MAIFHYISRFSLHKTKKQIATKWCVKKNSLDNISFFWNPADLASPLSDIVSLSCWNTSCETPIWAWMGTLQRPGTPRARCRSRTQRPMRSRRAIRAARRNGTIEGWDFFLGEQSLGMVNRGFIGGIYQPSYKWWYRTQPYVIYLGITIRYSWWLHPR